MHRFKLLYFVIFIINLYKVDAQISDKRLCVDEECKVPISHAKTLLRYSSPDSRILSFAPNADIIIYSKSAGSREDLWGGEINGKRGYVPKHMVRETKILHKATILVDTEFANDTGTQQVPSQVEPDKVQEPYEVVDGTTLYLSPQEDINPSSTDSPIQSTALPVETNKINQNVTKTPLNAEVLKTEPSSSQNQEELNNKSQTEEVPNSQDIQSEGKSGEVKENDAGKSPVQDETSTLDGEGDSEEDDENEIDVDEEDDEDESEEAEELYESVPSDENKSEVVAEDLELKNVEVHTEETGQDKLDTKADTEIHIEETSKDSVESKPDVPSEPPSDIVIPEDVANPNKETLGEAPSNEEIKSEEPLVNDSSDEGTKTETEDTKLDTVSTDPSPPPKNDALNVEEAVQKNESDSTDNIVASHFETTTLSPEFEVPQPFDDDLEVTPNPLEVTEEVPVAKETITLLPPLGLFAAANSDSLSTSYVQAEKLSLESVDAAASTESTIDQNSVEKEETVQNEDTGEETVTNKDTGEETVKDEDTVEETVTNKDTGEKTVKDEDTGEETAKLAESDSSQKSIEEEIKQNKGESGESTEQAAEWSFDEDRRNSEENVDSEESKSEGFFAGVLSFFGSGPDENVNEETFVKKEPAENEELTLSHISTSEEKHMGDDLHPATSGEPFCDATSCPKSAENEVPMENTGMDLLINFNSDVFLYLVTTAISVIIFLLGYLALDKSKREGPLIAKINKLEKELLIIVKENQILQEKVVTDSGCETNDKVPNEVVENLKQDLIDMTNIKNALEEQVQSLEKELENSTEVGMELNRMLSEILRSESGSDVLKSNVENLQRQLVEQQSTINSVNETLAITNTENHELRLELEISNKKVLDLQSELDKLLLNILKIEEEKEAQQASLESEIANLRQRHEEVNNRLKLKEEDHQSELKQLQSRVQQAERKLELKSKEHDVLTDALKQLKAVKNNEATLKNLLEVSGTKAEYQLLKTENQRLSDKLQQEQELKSSYEKKALAVTEETRQLKEKYDEADKLRVEAQTKLEVLSNYFKDREAQWQKEISKHEALWAEKEGEATSTTERIKFMQEQLQNYKAQTESLKQEIMSQEIELKSQISVLEKKAHENWVSARQAERKLEEAKQEAAQLRHRLTLRERAIQEDKSQHRLQTPIEQNGDMPVSPLESPASPPLLYGTRDHITKSPPIPGLPPFLPPPPGVPFMPPPIHGVPPFIPPPPPNMFPGDHRPPPLGRMSSPPLNSRYSPSSRGYSPYDRNSSSPSDSEYGTSPPHRRGYSPFNNRSDDRRDYKRPPPARNNGRNLMKGGGSSGSGHSNESLEKISRQQSKV